MNTRLQLVSDRSTEGPDTHQTLGEGAQGGPPEGLSGDDAIETIPFVARRRRLRGDEAGAVTAEYAIVIMAAVAFAGLLVAIMRSREIRAMLVQLVENALGAAG